MRGRLFCGIASKSLPKNPGFRIILDRGTKGQENPEFYASVTSGSFPYNPVVGSGTFGNGPVGPEILSCVNFLQKLTCFSTKLFLKPSSHLYELHFEQSYTIVGLRGIEYLSVMSRTL